MIGFLVYSKRLPKLILKWTQIDKAMNKVYGYPKGLSVRIIAFFVGFLTCLAGRAYICLCTIPHFSFTAIIIIDVTTYVQSCRRPDGSIDIKAYILKLSPYSSVKYTDDSYIAGIISFVSPCHTKSSTTPIIPIAVKLYSYIRFASLQRLLNSYVLNSSVFEI